MTKHDQLQDKSKQLIEAEKIKISKLATLLVNVGTWKLLARDGVQLFVKFYYEWRKIILEILRNGSKEIIEIDWTNIISMRVTIVETYPAFLELELLHPPRFFKEMNPDPQKHPKRIEVSDFTQGQASTERKQLFMFPKGELNKHLMKLTEYEKYFRELCMKPYPMMIDCPKFIPNCDEIQIQRTQRPVYDDFIRLPSPDELPVANMSNQEIQNQTMGQLNQRMNYNVGIGGQMGSIAPNNMQIQSHRGQHAAAYDDFIKLTPPDEIPAVNFSNQEIQKQRLEPLEQRVNYTLGTGDQIGSIVANNYQLGNYNTERNPNSNLMMNSNFGS